MLSVCRQTGSYGSNGHCRLGVTLITNGAGPASAASSTNFFSAIFLNHSELVFRVPTAKEVAVK